MMQKTKRLNDLIIDAYFELKEELGKRTTYLEMYLQSGFEDVNIAREFGSYVGMLQEIGELTAEESEAFKLYSPLLLEVEKTAMTKSYKMVVLKCMLERGESSWHLPVTANAIADGFIHYLSVPYRKKIDTITEDRAKAVKLIETMPMTKWSGSSKGLVKFDDGLFSFNVTVEAHFEGIVYGWINEICNYRLHRYFAKKAERLN